MTTKITVIYDTPADPAAFEMGYPDHVALARELPGVQRVECAKGFPKEQIRSALAEAPTADGRDDEISEEQR